MPGRCRGVAARRHTRTRAPSPGPRPRRFKVIAHSATNNCGATAAKHCFIALTYPHADQTCAGTPGPVDAGIYPIPNGFVSTTGRFSYRQADPDETFVATITAHGASGSFRTHDATCDTGLVTWKATRG